MEVILLENMRNLGPFGSKVKVAPGFGRNYLVPMGKAVPASAANLAKFEAERGALEEKANVRLLAAKARAEKIDGLRVTITARAADEGKLYGSIGTTDIANALTVALKSSDIVITRQEVRLPNGVIREIGEVEVQLQLHAEVVATVTIIVAAE